MEEKMTFIATDEQGNNVECEALFTFDSEETGKSYIAYTDNTLDEQGNTKVYASTYTPGEEKTALKPIESEKEWKMVEAILEELGEAAEGEKGEKSE
jgi:Uncharacterized protein conserved in bacteria